MLEQILINGGVDLVVQGHVHNYERFYPMNMGVPQATGNSTAFNTPGYPIYVACGAPGNNEGLGAATSPLITGSILSLGTTTSNGGGKGPGSLVCEFTTTATTLTFQAVVTYGIGYAAGASNIGKNADSFTITK